MTSTIAVDRFAPLTGVLFAGLTIGGDFLSGRSRRGRRRRGSSGPTTPPTPVTSRPAATCSGGRALLRHLRRRCLVTACAVPARRRSSSARSWSGSPSRRWWRSRTRPRRPPGRSRPGPPRQPGRAASVADQRLGVRADRRNRAGPARGRRRRDRIPRGAPLAGLVRADPRHRPVHPVRIPRLPAGHGARRGGRDRARGPPGSAGSADGPRGRSGRLNRTVDAVVPAGHLDSGGHGVWRSLVAHLLWEQGAAGSNPATPTSAPRVVSRLMDDPASSLPVDACQSAIRGALPL